METKFHTILTQDFAGYYARADWRNDEALRLVGQQRTPSRRCHDRVTSELAEYYREFAQCRSYHDLRRLKELRPYAHAAVEIHDNAPRHVRSTLEALVLATADDETIGGRLYYVPEVIKFYESAFFDVRTRLHEREFILGSVIKLDQQESDPEECADTALKLFGFLGGVPAVDLLTCATRPVGNHQAIRTVLLSLATRARAVLQLSATSGTQRANPQQMSQTLEWIASLERMPAPFGDENAPRTPEKVIEQKLFAIIRGQQNAAQGA